MRLHVRHWGLSGPAVVLVHGHVVSSRYMAPLGRELGRHCRVFAPDLPGFGLSEKPAHALDIPQLADAVHQFVSTANIDSPILIGNSMGSQVILDLIARHGAASGIVLLGPTMDQQARSVPRQFLRLIADTMFEQRLLPLAGIYLRDLWRTGLEIGWETLQSALADRPEDKAPQVDAPMLVVRGANDSIAPYEWSARLTKLAPNATLMTIPGAAHGAHYSVASQVAEAILPFVLRNGRKIGATEILR